MLQGFAAAFMALWDRDSFGAMGSFGFLDQNGSNDPYVQAPWRLQLVNRSFRQFLNDFGFEMDNLKYFSDFTEVQYDIYNSSYPSNMWSDFTWNIEWSNCEVNSRAD